MNAEGNWMHPDDDYFPEEELEEEQEGEDFFAGRKAIEEALLFSRWDVLEELLRQGVDFTFLSENGDTLLHYWAKTPLVFPEGDSEFVKNAEQTLKVLLSAGLDINVRNKKGDTPLHLACLYSNKHKVEILLKAGANPNLRNFQGETPLFLLPSNDTDTAKVLLLHGADPNAKGRREEPLLVRIASKKLFREENYHAQLQFLHLLLETGANPTEKSPQGNSFLTAFLRTIYYTDLRHSTPKLPESFVAEARAILKKALEQGANPNEPDDRGRYPLHYAIWDPDLVEILLRYGADPNVWDANGNTPAHVAATDSAHPLEVFCLLAKAGADLNAENSGGVTPIIAWMYQTNWEIERDAFVPIGEKLEELKNLGMRFDKKFIEALFTLWSEAFDPEVQKVGHIFRFLAQKTDFSLEERDEEENTFLHKACALHKPSLARLFLELGANPWTLNAKGETPGDVLVKRRREAHIGKEPVLPNDLLAYGLLPLKEEDALFEIFADEGNVLQFGDKLEEFFLWFMKESPESLLTFAPRLATLPKGHPAREIAIKTTRELGENL